MEQFLALKASAGSGKTFALTVRYISLLFLGAKPSTILTLTFTNKAASEMSSRIYSTLLSLGEELTILEAISKETSISKDEILAKKDEILNIFIKDELAIYTIDKFINKILREFSGYVGISDDFDIKFDDEELLVYKFLASLDEKQFFSLISFSYDYNKKIDAIINLFKILLEKNIEYKKGSFDFALFEVLQNNILENSFAIKEFILAQKLSNRAFSAVDFDSIDSLLKKGKTWLTKDRLGEFTYFKKATIPYEIEERFSSLKEDLSSYFKLKEQKILYALFDIFNHFKNFRDSYNKKRGSLEFSDITNIVYKLLQNHIDKDFLYFRLDSKYNHILIDEFQDTSTIQFEILYSLISEIISGDPEVFKTFFYVGDTKQSIYRFRGGTKELFDYVANIFEPLKVGFLDTNYRSSKNVVEFVNTTFNNIKDYEYIDQKVNSQIEGFVKTTTIQSDNYLSGIKDEVEFLLKSGIDQNNIAILTYTNSDVLNIYEYLKENIKDIQIITELTSKLINQTNVEAIINGIKYIYFQEEIYKVNFNSLIGLEYLDDFEFKVDSLDISVQQLVKEFAYFYNLIDANVIKFIEVCSSYSSLVDFIYNIDKDDTPMVSISSSGLQILTIFKSKGLEFDTVIVCDRIKAKNISKDPLLFEYDNIELKHIYYKNSLREEFDLEYKRAVEKEKRLVYFDEINILYVALTRAKTNMIVVKKDKKSVFDMVNIQNSLKGSLYRKQQQKKDITIETLQYTPLNLGYQLKQISSDEEDDNIVGKYFGLATHYCLEILPKFDIKYLKNAMQLVKSKFNHIVSSEQFDDIESRIKMLLCDSRFLSLIDGGSFYKEQSFIYNGEHKIVDLLIKKDQKYIIVDYKTSQEQFNIHKIQLSTYIKATKAILKTKDVEGYLIYLNKDIIDIVR